MRILESYEMKSTCEESTKEFNTYSAPFGYTFTTTLETNQTTTFRLISSTGYIFYQKNTGHWAACFTLASGTGLMVESYRANRRIKGISKALSAIGCTIWTESTGEDGDAYEIDDCDD